MTTRTLHHIIPSTATSDGAGVKLRRSLGARQEYRVDPFLMLDEFSSNDPDDYIAGFPAHPHRGFDTLTYILEGHMLHEDHMGNRGELTAGGVQWMRAGRGVIHSEMPQQSEGRLRGFQLWLNLPAREKMSPAAYRDIQADEIPTVELPDGASARVIAGTLQAGAQTVRGPISGGSTDPGYLDVILPAGSQFRHAVPDAYAAIVYAVDGTLRLGEHTLAAHSAGVLSDSGDLRVGAKSDARFLVLSGRPIREPVVQYGPFVMNTREEIDQALADYRGGTLTEPAKIENT